MTHYLQSLIKAFQRLPMTALMTAPFKTTMKAAMLLVVAMMLMPQMAMGKGRWQDKYLPGGSSDNKVIYKDGIVQFDVCIYDADGNDAGFEGYYGGVSVEFSKDGGNSYTRVFHGSSNVYGAMNVDGLDYQDRDVNDKTASYNSGVGSATVKSWWGKEDNRWVTVKITLNKQWLNCNISVRSSGKWEDYNEGGVYYPKSRLDIVSSTYTHTIRKIQWDGDYKVASDGTVTIPYKFENTKRTTDGETHICTRIDGSYNGKIGYRHENTTNYDAGTYTFKLSDIGKNMCSEFTIQPYHEFTHYNDKDVNNGVKYYFELAGVNTFRPLPKATISNAAFNQKDKNVKLTWTASNKNYSNGRWVIYHGNDKVGVVNQDTTIDVYSYVDTNMAFESDEKYAIYYVMNNWSDKDKVAELGADVTVNTTRSLLLRNFNAESLSDRVVLTWQSDSLPANWGHGFNIYVDNKKVYTVDPKDGQSAYRWEHRTTDQHTDPIANESGDTLYVEEPLSGAKPHNYRVEGIIDGLVFSADSVAYRGIGTATMFYSFDATKNTYAGQVRLSWHVNRQGSNLEQTYIVLRKRAESEKDVWTTLSRFSSSDNFLYYTDDTPLPGVCYTYRILVQDTRSDGSYLENQIDDIGFAQASGTVSGRITFGTSGMAVQGVNVVAKQIDGEDAEEQYHAVRFTGENGLLTWKYPSKEYAQKTFGQNDWTVQLWLNPDSIKQQVFVKMGHYFQFGMSQNGASRFWLRGNAIYGAPNYSAGEYQHLTIAKSNDSIRFWLINSKGEVTRKSYQCQDTINFTPTSLTIGGFTGYVDEFRLWTKALTEAEILENYDHLLVGSEKNLEIYWPLDEGLNTQFFDYSREGTVYHGHHGTMSVNTQSDNYVPKQLALRAKTDSVGNYIIRGVPFSGEGTTYAIIPTLGVHSFNPTQQLRYISANSLVHNGTDFDDVSSFPVSGTVYYAGTNYPVEGCNFYVDGQICSKDGELIETNSYGQFTISVPIGEHFIQVKKQGHEFVNNGRYPAEAGTYVNFDRELKNLAFYDSTLVNFTGRVVGGDIEGDKPVGFGQSINNIGVATFTLTPRGIENTNYYINAILPTDGTVIQYKPNPNIDSVASASPDTIHSKAWRGFGSKDECQKFYICTDSLTGEFSAMLPPLDYIIESIKIASSPELVILKNQIALDMTNPQIVFKDSVQGDTAMRYYEYHTVLRQTYHSQPVFTVQQANQTDGSFGINSREIEDATGKMTINDIHHINADTVEYTYGYPLFVMGSYYTFNLKGYEEYINKDKSDYVTSQVPLANTVVTIENALSADQVIFGEDNPIGADPGSVYELKSNQLLLDSTGVTSYRWMAGLPNITPPYARSLNIYYTVGDIDYDWTGNSMEAVILGNLSTGNNFVTDAPDKLDMILRDPPGSQSFATWESGTVMEYDTVRGSTWNQELEVKTVSQLGTQLTAAAGAIAAYTITTVTVDNDLTVGVKEQCEGESANTIVRKFTATRAISTSDSPEYVGADGDLFIGSSTNITFGKTRSVDLYRSTTDHTKAVLDMQDALSADVKFGTKFAYTQWYIENTLIPNFISLRETLLETVDVATYNSTNSTTGNKVRYITPLSKDHPDYGIPGTYKALLPASMSGEQDMVDHYTSQIDAWKGYLRDNEQAKVNVYKQRDELKESNAVNNYSFDAGSRQTISHSSEVSRTHSYRINRLGAALLGYAIGLQINKTGVVLDMMSSTGGGTHHEDNRTKDTTATFSYTFRDDDVTDALSVDVYEYQQKQITYKQWKKDNPGDSIPGMKGESDTTLVTVNVEPDYHAPIFRTRGGQTSNPYEGTVYTR